MAIVAADAQYNWEAVRVQLDSPFPIARMTEEDFSRLKPKVMMDFVARASLILKEEAMFLKATASSTVLLTSESHVRTLLRCSIQHDKRGESLACAVPLQNDEGNSQPVTEKEQAPTDKAPDVLDAPDAPDAPSRVSPEENAPKASASARARARASRPKTKVSNAFMVFGEENRVNLMQQHPSLPMGEISAMLGDWWRSLDEYQQQPYYDESYRRIEEAKQAEEEEDENHHE
ncbi:hypothetical protein F5Y16DRAFT_395668 [Xylariaceae sp. FL0255]|nr:hypothetical protein F5Y16DRAFT_395668 [Xylariaceae sp. FL0255]